MTSGSLYYRGAQAVLLTYDITNRKTFESVDRWKEKWDSRQTGEEELEPVSVLVGCKTDLEHSRQVGHQPPSKSSLQQIFL